MALLKIKKLRLFIEVYGNMLEWYDAMMYVYLINIFSHTFFASGNSYTNYILTWAIYAGSYIFRPIGGYLFGYFADVFNQYNSLYASVLLMGVSSVVLACIPSYQEIGVYAPIILFVIRIIQVISSAGQFSGSVVMLGSYGEGKPKAKYLKYPQIYSLIGMMLAGVVNILGQHFFSGWGSGMWRLAYVFGFFMLLGYIFLLRLQFSQHKNLMPSEKTTSMPKVISIFKAYWKPIIFVSMLVASSYSFLCVSIVLYLPTYIKATVDLSSYFVYGMILSGNLIMVISFFASSNWYDKLSLKQVYRYMIIGMPCITVLAFSILGQSILSVMVIIVMASLIYPLYAYWVMFVMVCIFPEEVRFRCASFSYNLGMCLSSIYPVILSIVMKKYGFKGFDYTLLLNAIISMVILTLIHNYIKNKSVKDLFPAAYSIS